MQHNVGAWANNAAKLFEQDLISIVIRSMRYSEFWPNLSHLEHARTSTSDTSPAMKVCSWLEFASTPGALMDRLGRFMLSGEGSCFRGCTSSSRCTGCCNSCCSDVPFAASSPGALGIQQDGMTIMSPRRQTITSLEPCCGFVILKQSKTVSSCTFLLPTLVAI